MFSFLYFSLFLSLSHSSYPQIIFLITSTAAIFGDVVMPPLNTGQMCVFIIMMFCTYQVLILIDYRWHTVSFIRLLCPRGCTHTIFGQPIFKIISITRVCRSFFFKFAKQKYKLLLLRVVLALFVRKPLQCCHDNNNINDYKIKLYYHLLFDSLIFFSLSRLTLFAYLWPLCYKTTDHHFNSS